MLSCWQNGRSFQSSSLTFANNYALNADMVGMPAKDFTAEFWARTPAYNKDAPGHNTIADLFTYATHIPEAQSICEPPALLLANSLCFGVFSAG